MENKTVTSEDGIYSIELEKEKENSVRIGDALRLKPIGNTKVTADQDSYDLVLDKSLVKVSGEVSDAAGNALNYLYISLCEENTNTNLGGFRTDFDGKYSQWLEKDAVYSVFMGETGKTYDLKKLHTADATTYNLLVDDTLCLVEGTLKNTDGTVATCDEMYVGNRKIQLENNGKYSFWISSGVTSEVQVMLPDCPVKCRIGFVTGGDPVTYELVLELEMCNVAGKLVYADKSNVEEFEILAYKGSQSWSSFVEEGEKGEFSFSLPNGEEYTLKANIGGKTYPLGILVSGDENTYSWELPVTLQKIWGSLQALNGISILEQKIIFYEDAEKTSSYCAVTTDAEGKYKAFLEKGKTYYPVAKLIETEYDMASFEVRNNQNFNMQIERELSDIADIEVKTEYFTTRFLDRIGRTNNRWELYKDDRGAVGEMEYATFGSSVDKHVYLPMGEKLHLRLRNWWPLTMGQMHPKYDFYAGTIIVGDLSTYQKTVSLCNLEGVVCDRAGMQLVSSFTTQASDMSIEGISGYGTMGDICVTLRNTSDNTTLSSLGSENKCSMYGVPGEEYAVTVKVNQNIYDLGTIVASENNYEWRLDTEFAQVSGNVRSAEEKSGEITSSQDLMDAIAPPTILDAPLNGYLRFYEKETDRDSSYQAQCAVLGDFYSLYLEKGKSYYVRRGVQSSYGSYEWIDCGIIVAGDESTYNIDTEQR